MLLFVIIEHTKKYDIFLSHMQARIIVFERRGQTHPKNLNKQKTKEQKDNSKSWKSSSGGGGGDVVFL